VAIALMVELAVAREGRLLAGRYLLNLGERCRAFSKVCATSAAAIALL